MRSLCSGVSTRRTGGTCPLPTFQAGGQSCESHTSAWKAAASTDRAIDNWHPTAATSESKTRRTDGVVSFKWVHLLTWLFRSNSPVCKGGNRANWSKSMKFGTLVLFNMLNPNLPGAKANFQRCRHTGRFKMAARQKLISFLLVNEKS